MAESLLASVLHLSDPHLADQFDYDPALIPTWVRQVGAYFSKGRPLGMPHDSAVLALLPAELLRVRSLVQKRYPSFTDFDAAIVTGDLLTLPYGPPSYDRFAHDWLTATVATRNHGHTGLQLAPDRLVVIPGNHDRLGQKHCDQYQASRFVTARPQLGPAGRHTQSAQAWWPFVRTISNRGRWAEFARDRPGYQRLSLALHWPGLSLEQRPGCRGPHVRGDT